MKSEKGFVESPKPTARNRYVITDQLVIQVHKKMCSGRPLFDGDIADLIWGPNSKRPESRTAFHEAFSQLNKRYKQKYGVELISTTAHRPERYSGEKAERREANRRGGRFDPNASST
jgi:hypothetical protein